MIRSGRFVESPKKTVSKTTIDTEGLRRATAQSCMRKNLKFIKLTRPIAQDRAGGNGGLDLGAMG